IENDRFLAGVIDLNFGRMTYWGDAMKAKVHQDGEVTVVEISGYLDFESAAPLRHSIDVLYQKNRNAKVVIDLKGLEFVGSSGVSSFVKSLRVFNNMKNKPCYCGVKSEFLRLFRAFEETDPFEVLEDKETARAAAVDRYNLWQMTTKRSRATH